VEVLPLSAERVRQLLSLCGNIKPAPRPIVVPDPTEVRLELDRRLLFRRARAAP
jgi:hypothetical protein